MYLFFKFKDHFSYLTKILSITKMTSIQKRVGARMSGLMAYYKLSFFKVHNKDIFVC
jgi:hypothetical protein